MVHKEGDVRQSPRPKYPVTPAGSHPKAKGKPEHGGPGLKLRLVADVRLLPRLDYPSSPGFNVELGLRGMVDNERVHLMLSFIRGIAEKLSQRTDIFCLGCRHDALLSENCYELIAIIDFGNDVVNLLPRDLQIV